ncbi:MAG TPA: hypothetical protein VE545_02540, partial [Candidatus Dormibacteraeota bacterium]|nr:hypothetical protein [Candidatus Dormibacteraeota bacterium]
AGLTDREETRSITGLPGFAEIPGPPGYAFGDHNDTYQDTELLIVLTPRRLRSPSHDTKSIYAGRGEANGPSGGGGGGRQFIPRNEPQPLPEQPEPPQPGAPPGAQQRGAPQPSVPPQPGVPPSQQQPPPRR